MLAGPYIPNIKNCKCMNKLSTGDIAIGSPDSMAREKQWVEISEREAVSRLGLPPGHSYGSMSPAARYVEAFIEGAKWQRNNPQ
jgi:hypothetical protein